MRHFNLRAARFMAVICMSLALMAAFNPRAFAHAALVQAEPPDGSVLANAPKKFMLKFNEPVAPIALRLIGSDGQAVALDHYRLLGSSLDVEAPPGIAAGTHLLSWRVISEDGHPVGGSVVFSIGAPDAGPHPAFVQPDNRGLASAVWLCRLIIYASLFFGIGGVFFTTWFGASLPQVAQFLAALLAAGLVAAPLSVGLQGLDVLDRPLAALFVQVVIWQAGLAANYGTTALLAMAALALACAGLALSSRPVARLLSLLAILGVGTALAASGHASTAPPAWLMRPSVFVHGVCVAFWIGALGPLAAGLGWGAPGSDAALRAFSRAIPFALALLSAAGLVLSMVQLESLDAFNNTAYGQVLLLKILLLTGLLGLAVLNRWTLTGQLEAGSAAARRSMVRSIAFETMFALAILGTVALWRFTPPPRALAAAASMPAHLHIHAEKAMADISISPGRAAAASVAIYVLAGDFGAVDAKEVSLALSSKSLGVEPVRRQAKRGPDGAWRVDEITIPAAGRWNIRVDILVNDFEQVTLEDSLDVRP